MASPKIALSPISVTVDAVNSTAAATGTALNDITGRTKPLRYYESSVSLGTNTDIYFDLGSVVDVGAVFIDNVNVSSADVGMWSHSTLSTVFSSGSNDLPVVAPVLDRKTGRYKYFWERSQTDAKQYFGLRIAAGATVTEGSAARIGAVTFIARTNYLDLPGGYQYPLDYEVIKPQVVNRFLGGTIEPVSVGSRFVKLALPVVDYIRETQQTGILNILSNELTPVTFFENNSELEKAYTFFIESSKSSKIKYKNQEVLSVSFVFTETL